MKLEVTRWGMDGFDLVECDDGDYVPFDEVESAVSVFEATLAARDAEIERLKDKAIRFDLDQIGIESRERDAVELVEARTEIERLKAMVETIERDLSEANGDVFIACAKVRSEIEIREKRERQLVWALRACGDDEALKFYGLDILAVSDDAGLLAAIDEATQEKPDPR